MAWDDLGQNFLKQITSTLPPNHTLAAMAVVDGIHRFLQSLVNFSQILIILKLLVIFVNMGLKMGVPLISASEIAENRLFL